MSLAKGKKEYYGLLKTLKHRILIHMLGSSKNTKILIVDERSVKIINSICTVSEVYDQDVVLIEKLELNRQAFKDFDAVYFITPNKKNINLIDKDFKKKKYKAAHIFFTSEIKNNLSIQIRNSSINPHIKTLQELFIDFYALEPKLFKLDSSQFRILYNVDGLEKESYEMKLRKSYEFLANKIVSVCLVLGRVPVIRYIDSKLGTDISEDLAKIVFEKLNRKFSIYLDPTKKPLNILILDRSIDFITPIVHDFYYQSLAYDLLETDVPKPEKKEKKEEKEKKKRKRRIRSKTLKNIEEESSTFIENRIAVYHIESLIEKDRRKETVLNENNNIWTSTRHTFIADTARLLEQGFKDFSENSQIKMLKENNKLDPNIKIKDLSKFLRAFPNMDKLYKDFSAHIHVVGTLLDTVQKDKLRMIGELELEIIYANKKEKTDKLLQFLKDSQVKIEDKIRLIMLYMIIKKINSSDNMMKRLRSNRKQDEILDYIDEMTEDDKKIVHNFIKIYEKELDEKDKVLFENKVEDEDYALKKYAPHLKYIIKQFISNKLPTNIYPLLTNYDRRNMFRKKSTYRFNEKKEPKEISHIVFMAGGATYSEIRTIYELSEKYDKNIVIGTDDVLTPKKFLKELI